ncbi:hypothetical protein BZL29_0758 [Mycobacterium kansasii]|uniref:Uncharacterized protein n=1 Tax=Mycobacterium kansasii TaxID=1768 RepID=A0A1V3XZJ0_MYCKA|nr:hypothetical protein BZL29_0758 [Mycobacterium kansasii]
MGVRVEQVDQTATYHLVVVDQEDCYQDFTPEIVPNIGCSYKLPLRTVSTEHPAL